MNPVAAADAEHRQRARTEGKERTAINEFMDSREQGRVHCAINV
jgi:hypothetical protein